MHACMRKVNFITSAVCDCVCVYNLDDRNFCYLSHRKRLRITWLPPIFPPPYQLRMCASIELYDCETMHHCCRQISEKLHTHTQLRGSTEPLPHTHNQPTIHTLHHTDTGSEITLSFLPTPLHKSLSISFAPWSIPPTPLSTELIPTGRLAETTHFMPHC